MNYTEMEAKVREATNNEPWGASSTVSSIPSSWHDQITRVNGNSSCKTSQMEPSITLPSMKLCQ